MGLFFFSLNLNLSPNRLLKIKIVKNLNLTIVYKYVVPPLIIYDFT